MTVNRTVRKEPEIAASKSNSKPTGTATAVVGPADIAHQVPASVVLAWGLQAAPSRGPRPGLTIAAVVHAAIELADEGGIAAVSMARVARKLGYTTMSLYRYVETKADLVLLMGDEGLGEPPDTILAALTWEQAIDVWARSVLTVYRSHPWIFDVPLSSPPAMPNQLSWLDALLQGLAGTGLTDQEQLSTALLVDGYVRGWAQLVRSITESAQREATGQTRSMTPGLLRSLVTADRYPALAPMIANGEFDDDVPDDGEASIDDEFEFSLARIIAGVNALIVIRDQARRRS